MPPRRSLTLPAPQPTPGSSDVRGYPTNAAIPSLHTNASVCSSADPDEPDLIAGIFGGYSINIVKTSSSPLGMVLQVTRGAHLIKRVVAGGAAAGRGVVAGDALVAVNGASMLRKSHDEVIAVLSSSTAVLTLTLAPLEAAAAAAAAAAASASATGIMLSLL